jgi:hypothetical protein
MFIACFPDGLPFRNEQLLIKWRTALKEATMWRFRDSFAQAIDALPACSFFFGRLPSANYLHTIWPPHRVEFD